MVPKVLLDIIHRVEPLYGYRVQFTEGPWAGTQTTILGINKNQKTNEEVFYLDTDCGEKINVLYFDELGCQIVAKPGIIESNAITLDEIDTTHYDFINFLAGLLNKITKNRWLRYTPGVFKPDMMEAVEKKICYTTKNKKINDKYVNVETLDPKSYKASESQCRAILGEIWGTLSKSTQKELISKTMAILGQNLDKPSRALLWFSDELSFSPVAEYPIRLARQHGIPIINFHRPDWRATFSVVFPSLSGTELTY